MFGRLRPLDGHYRVHDQLLAGEYPGGRDWRGLRAGLRRLLEAGVTYFLDLTEEGEKGMVSYAPALRAEAREMGRAIEHRRMPISDFETPTAAQMRGILDALDAALADGHRVYVHCYAGIGRTGTVVGCYLVRHGRSGQEALAELVRLRRGTALEGALSPVTDEQRKLVYEWAARDRER
jgi:protein-tyrosine phosphatase